MSDVSGGSVVWQLDVDSAKLSKGLSDARNEAAKTADQIDKSFDDVKASSQSAAQSFADFAQSAVVGATAITGALALIGKGALDSASQFQIARISFDTMIGNTELAGKKLAELSDFAAKTPFTLPEVLQGAKSLMAMGSSTDDLIPELKALGDVSAGLDVPMSRLIQNFGQVRTQGKLTGKELRDFNVAGVPLIDELVKQFNAQGGVLTTVGATSAKTKKQLDSLTDTLQKQTNRMDDMNKKTDKSSASYKNLGIDIQNTKDKLAGIGPVSAGVSKRIKVTKQDIADMVSDGKISFEMVQKAFMSMTGEGGKFNNLMDNLSKTFSGRMSNISDNASRLGAAFMGVSTAGDVLAGGLFDRISTGAQMVLDLLNEITPQAQGFMQVFLNNGPAVASVIGAIVGLLVPLGIALVTLLAPALAFAAAGAAIAFAFVKLIEYMGGFDAVKERLVKAFGDITSSFKGIKTAFDKELATWGPLLQGYIDIFVGQFKAFGERMYDSMKFDSSKMGIVDFFTQLTAAVMPALQRFGTNIQQGFTNVFKFEGGGGGFTDFIGNMIGLFTTLSDIVLRTVTPAWEALKASFVTSQPAFDYLAQQVGPLLINGLKLIAMAIAGVVIVLSALVSGIVQGFAMALPFIVTAMAGIAEVINGALNIIVGLFTLNFGQVLQGVKDIFSGMYNFIAGGITAIIALIAGFVKGVVGFFMNLYDILVGHSIIPDMVNEIVAWFAGMPDQIFAILSKLLTDVYDWGQRIAKSFVDGFSKIGDWLKEKVEAGLAKAKGALEGHSPPKEGPFQNIDQWGYNVGNSWVSGISKAIQDFSMPTNDFAYQAQDKSMFTPKDNSSQGRGGGQNIVVNIGTVQSKADVDMINQEIGFRASLLPAS